MSAPVDKDREVAVQRLKDGIAELEGATGRLFSRLLKTLPNDTASEIAAAVENGHCRIETTSYWSGGCAEFAIVAVDLATDERRPLLVSEASPEEHEAARQQMFQRRDEILAAQRASKN
jgi:hypothetical protein